MSEKSIKSCNNCIAETSSGEQCKRLASCEYGCQVYCWQHAKDYSKTGLNLTGKKSTITSSNQPMICEDPQFNQCNLDYFHNTRTNANINSISPPMLPCKYRNTVLWKMDDFKTLGYDRPLRLPRSEILKNAQNSATPLAQDNLLSQNHNSKHLDRQLRFSPPKKLIQQLLIPNRLDTNDQYLCDSSQNQVNELERQRRNKKII